MLFETYPRVRPPLTPAHERIFAAEYKLNRDGAASIEHLAKRVEGWMHRKVAGIPGSPALEIGAGTLNHLRFESTIADYDIVEPFRELFADSPCLPKVRRVFANQAEIPAEPSYVRIISVAVLEHLTDLPRELARSGLLLRADGVFQAGIPSEGGFLWWLGWRCTTGITYWLRNRLDYGVIVKHEHVNRAPEIIGLTRHFFRNVRITRFPLPAHQLSLYAYLEARDPDLERCRAAL